MGDDPFAGFFERWAWLPLISDPAFDRALAELIAREKIATIYTPHVVVRQYLDDRIERIAPGVRLSGLVPENRRRVVLEDLTRRAALADHLVRPATDSGLPSPLDATRRIGLLKQALHIDGQCSEEKIWALAEMARSAPAGDIVEIGSAWGRSAFVLGWLARHHRLGAVLCIDPWTNPATRQTEAMPAVNAVIDRMNIDRMFTEFVTNMASVFDRDFNYMRTTSEAAFDAYDAASSVATPEFGRTDYQGRISILHIDGNHDFAVVRRDLECWPLRVAAGGWIVLDDYCWPFADGPRRAGDAFLDAYGKAVARAFVQAGALFIQLSQPLAPDASRPDRKGGMS